MTADVKAMLDRVIVDVFDEGFVTQRVSSTDPMWLHGVQLSSQVHKDRAAIIRVGVLWMDAFKPELDVQALILDEDDDVAYKEEELTMLCRALRVYLEGGGHVRQRRRLFGRGSTNVLTIEADGFQWRLGRSSWSGP
jgi:hypothetical protein